MHTRIAILALAAGLGAAANASADPYLISGAVATGTVTAYTSPPLAGDRLRWDLNGTTAGGTVFSFWGGYGAEDIGSLNPCNTCVAGETIRLNGTLAGLASLGNGGAFIGPQHDLESEWWTGTLNFDGGSLLLPSEAGDTYTAVLPFTFSGALDGWKTPNVGDDPSNLSIRAEDLGGRGLVTLRLASYADPQYGRVYEFRSIQYKFGNGAAPVPEPASMTLLGLGLAGTIARRMRRK